MQSGKKRSVPTGTLFISWAQLWGATGFGEAVVSKVTNT